MSDYDVTQEGPRDVLREQEALPKTRGQIEIEMERARVEEHRKFTETEARWQARVDHLVEIRVDHLVEIHGWLRPLPGSSLSDVEAQHRIAHGQLNEQERLADPVAAEARDAGLDVPTLQCVMTEWRRCRGYRGDTPTVETFERWLRSILAALDQPE
jgi:hypothetical protein